MTDEEHQKLVKWLRDMAHTYGQSVEYAQAADEIERLEKELQVWKNINGELNHQLHLWKCGSQFSGSSPNPPLEAGWGCVKSGSPGEWVSLEENERLRKELTAAEAALRNTLLHYKISDIRFLDSEEK
jgi:hypothetical protein